MGRPLRRIAGAAAVFAAALAIAEKSNGESSTGKLAPELRLEGKDAGESCAFSARSKADQTFESESGEAIDVPPGQYELRVECKVEEEAILVPPSTMVTVAAGKTVSPRIEVKAARLRVEARRNTVMLPAKVRLRAPGARPESKPLVEVPANQRVTVATGRYDVWVALDDPRSPHAEELLPGAHVGGSNLTVLSADLSDGGLIVAAIANGKKSEASVRVFSPGSTKDLGIAEAGAEVRLPAGRYIASTELRDTADFATKKQDVWIRAGKVLRITEQFETGMMSVTVERDKTPVAATVRLSLPGAADFFNHFSAPGAVTLSPGVYDVSIASEALGPLKMPARTGIKVARGQHARVAFDLTQATLVVKATKRGQPAEAEIKVRAAGGGEEIGSPDASGVMRLWPGRYEIDAKLAEGDEMIDGPFEVRLGQKVVRTVNFVRGMLTVDVTRGKSGAADADVLVFRPGAAKPSAKGRPGARFELPPGVYDVKVIAGSEVVWREGVRLKTQQVLHVELPARGKEEALPEGDLSAPEEEMPEGE